MGTTKNRASEDVFEEAKLKALKKGLKGSEKLYYIIGYLSAEIDHLNRKL